VGGDDAFGTLPTEFGQMGCGLGSGEQSRFLFKPKPARDLVRLGGKAAD